MKESAGRIVPFRALGGLPYNLDLVRNDPSRLPANVNWIRRSARSGQSLLLPEGRAVAEMQRYARNFHNQLKAKLLREKVTLQVVRETTLTPEDFTRSDGRPQRGTQDSATIAWNLCTTAFFKGEGEPWKLASVWEGVCYIGLVFKQDPTGHGGANGCFGAQMFLDSGDGVVFRGAMGPWWSLDRKEYHLSRQAAEQLAEIVVSEYSKQHRAPPRELSFMGALPSIARSGAAFPRRSPRRPILSASEFAVHPT